MPGTKRRFDYRRAAIGGVTILALLTLGALWQRAHPYSIETSTTIDASPQQVWAVLINDFDADTLEAQPAHLLRWESHEAVVGIFDGEHSFTLEELADGSTLLTQRALFRGVTVLFRTDELRDDTVPSLHAENAALRERVEADIQP